MLKELMDHRLITTTQGYYTNPRELHLTGEKPQVASSRQETEGLQRYYELTA
ncbi:hypothetical protein ABR737_40885 [Streptomyces sp. Edi2]|uniref:hypothetical protein n=1 Tax=Streptomyces sp. Edi2 TaxID=3162528 RepID=UPI003305B47A